MISADKRPGRRRAVSSSSAVFSWRTVARTTPRIVHRMVPAEAGVILVGGAASKDNLDRVEWVALP